MSLFHLARAMQITERTPLAKLVLIMMADRAKDNGECVISNIELAKICGTSVSRIVVSVRELESSHLIRSFHECNESAYLLTFEGDYY